MAAAARMLTGPGPPRQCRRECQPLRMRWIIGGGGRRHYAGRFSAMNRQPNSLGTCAKVTAPPWRQPPAGGLGGTPGCPPAARRPRPLHQRDPPNYTVAMGRVRQNGLRPNGRTPLRARTARCRGGQPVIWRATGPLSWRATRPRAGRNKGAMVASRPEVKTFQRAPPPSEESVAEAIRRARVLTPAEESNS
jgi:hypothetical protein